MEKALVAAKRILEKRKLSPTAMSVMVMVICLALATMMVPGFRTTSYFVSMLRLSAFLGLLVAGVSMVVITGCFDLSAASILSLSTIILGMTLERGYPIWVCVAAALAASMAVGLCNAVGVVFLKLPPLIMCIAMISLIDGVLLVITNGTPPGGMRPELTEFANNTWFFGLPNVVFIWIVVSVLVYWILSKSKWGRKIYAVGANSNCAYLSGISVGGVKFFVYLMSGLFAGISGILLFSYMQATYLQVGLQYQLNTMAAVVIGGISTLGGRGNYIGAVVGTLIMTILKDVLNVMNIQQAGRELFLGLIIVLILLLYGREEKQR